MGNFSSQHKSATVYLDLAANARGEEKGSLVLRGSGLLQPIPRPSASEPVLLERLHELGSRERARHVETGDYYSRPDVDFVETVECLRVRSRDGFAEITYKPGSTAANTADGTVSKVETNARLVDADQTAAAN